jgi:hypothetical protein
VWDAPLTGFTFLGVLLPQGETPIQKRCISWLTIGEIAICHVGRSHSAFQTCLGDEVYAFDSKGMENKIEAGETFGILSEDGPAVTAYRTAVSMM